MDAKSNTLFGSRVLPVKRNDQSDVEITIHQILLKDYPKAIVLMEDEIGLNALACGLTRTAIEELSPVSYNAVHLAVQEVNRDGFFSYAARQAERAKQNLLVLPPGMLEKIISSKLPPASPPAAR